jgi:hypothetical protein
MDNRLIPDEQYDRVFGQDMCDIDYEFLGFTEIYESLAEIIPKHWTVVDLGCAYSPQSWLFSDHKLYVGVDYGVKERFSAPNTRHFEGTIREFIERGLTEFNLDQTFAICSYVPPWHDDNRKIARENFKNVFVYYPSGGYDPIRSFSRAKRTPLDNEDASMPIYKSRRSGVDLRSHSDVVEYLERDRILKLAFECGAEEYGPMTWNLHFTREAWNKFASALSRSAREIPAPTSSNGDRKDAT